MGSKGSENRKLSFRDGPSFLAESPVYTQVDDFDDIRQSLTSNTSKCQLTSDSETSIHAFDPNFRKLINTSQASQVIIASSPFHQPIMQPPRDSPDASLLIEKMLSQQQQSDEDENRLPLGPSRRSDFASPAAALERTSTGLNNANEFGPETRIRASAPPSTLVKHAGLPESIEFYPPSNNYLTSIENIAVSSSRSSSIKPHSSSDLLHTDTYDSDSFRRPNITTVIASTKQSASRQTLSSISESDTQRPAAYSFSLTLNISAIDTEGSNFSFKIPQFTNTLCWTSPHLQLGMESKVHCAVNTAANRLNNSVHDWLMSGVLGMQTDNSGRQLQLTNPFPPVAASRPNDRGVSSSSSDYFVARKLDSDMKCYFQATPMRTDSSDAPSHISDVVTLKSNIELSSANSEAPTVLPGSQSQTNEPTLKSSSPLLNLSQHAHVPTTQDSSPVVSRVELIPGAQIYAQWKTDNFFYAGRIMRVTKDNRVRIKFEDNSSGYFHVKDVICVSLLPIGSKVAIDESDEGEYEFGYVVNGHEINLSDNDYSYSIRCINTGATLLLPRKQVAIVLDEVQKLVAAGLIFMGKEEVADIGGTPSTTLPFSPKAVVVKAKKSLPNMALGSPEVCLENVVYGRRSLVKQMEKGVESSTRKRCLRNKEEEDLTETKTESSEVGMKEKEKNLATEDSTQESFFSVNGNSVSPPSCRRNLRRTQECVEEGQTKATCNGMIDDEEDEESTQEVLTSLKSRTSSQSALPQSEIDEHVKPEEQVMIGHASEKPKKEDQESKRILARRTNASSVEGSSEKSVEVECTKIPRKKTKTTRTKYQRRRSGLDRRESLIWAFGRRAIASASMSGKPRTPNRVRLPRPASTKTRIAVAAEGLKSPRSSRNWKRQKLDDFTDPVTTPQVPAPVPKVQLSTLIPPLVNLTDTDASTQPMLIDSNQLMGVPLVHERRARVTRSHNSMSYVVGELNRLCRKYNIPVPKRHLFSNWAIVLTSGVSQPVTPANNPSNLTPIQLEACTDRTFLTILVTAGGGQLLQTIEANLISTTGRLLDESSDGVSYIPASAVSNDGRHVALVAPTFMRTLKFLQGLATLGRVPLLHATWLIDACLTAEKNPQEQQLVCEVPLNLLKTARFSYELPRGLDHQFNQIVATDVVPALYTEDSGAAPLNTLLSTLGCLGLIVAIVTDDTRNFGQGWISILRLASTYENERGARVMSVPPRLLSVQESLAWLTAWQQSSSNTDEVKQIVFIDQERIPATIIPKIEALGFVLINKEYLIHSLIHGKMLNLKHGLAWSSA